MQRTDRVNLAIAERARLRRDVVATRQQVVVAQRDLAAERTKTAEAEARAGNNWRMFGQAQQQLHALRAAVIDAGGNPDEMIRERRSRNHFLPTSVGNT